MTTASAPGPVQDKREDMRCVVPYSDRRAGGRGNCKCVGSRIDPDSCISSCVSPNETALEKLCQQLGSLVKLQPL